MRIARIVAAATALAAVTLVAAGAGRSPAAATAVGGTVTIDVTPGPHWLRPDGREAPPEPTEEGAPETDGEAAEGRGAGADGPQVAVWLEDPTGAFVSTIYVTRRAAVEDWLGVAGADDGAAVTPRPLPVWAGSHRGVGIEPMAACGACHGKRRSDDKTIAGDPILEAMTGPSPGDGLTREWRVPERVEPGTYGIRVEINHWMDPNERYAADLPAGDPDASGGSTGSGQPSLVWGGVVEIGPRAHEGGLSLIGRGHPSGASGEIEVDLAGLTTALSIVDTIHVMYAPAE